jgi:hypothetical protein
MKLNSEGLMFEVDGKIWVGISFFNKGN